ncbi:MAG TPA: hypothetical protein VF407_11705, partial [Polyangiaceae bacterium]
MTKGNAFKIVWLPLVAALTLLVGCGDSDPPIGGGGTGGGGTGGSCATPSSGCACDSVGATNDCGHVVQQSGTYVTCSEGTMTCGADGKWGECIGEYTSTKDVSVAYDLQMQRLGPSQACVNNPCDPYCQ